MAAKGNALAVWPQADRTLKLECVFGNNSHFSRAFKAAFGRRPSGAHSARIVTKGYPQPSMRAPAGSSSGACCSRASRISPRISSCQRPALVSASDSLDTYPVAYEQSMWWQ